MRAVQSPGRDAAARVTQAVWMRALTESRLLQRVTLLLQLCIEGWLAQLAVRVLQRAHPTAEQGMPWLCATLRHHHRRALKLAYLGHWEPRLRSPSQLRASWCRC